MKHTIQLPDSVATFDATDFGNYGPRGYNPNAKSGVRRGTPISYLFSGRWLEQATEGSGTLFEFRDAKGALVGTAFKPSPHIHEWFEQLYFHPTKPLSPKP